jgi:hypothetical protein
LVYEEKHTTLILSLFKPLDIALLKELIREKLQLEVGEITRLKYEEYDGGDQITMLDRDDVKEGLRREILFIT